MPPESDSTPGWLQSSGETGYGTDNANFEEGESSSSSSSLPFLQQAQSVSSILSIFLSPLAVILVSVWASNLGGVSWTQGESGRVFNWHPVLMVTAYAIMNIGALVFRVSGTSSYQTSIARSSSSATAVLPSEDAEKKRGFMKIIHGSIWSSSFIFGTVAMVAVFKSHNDPISGYIANLYSFHSWVGILVLSLYTLQFVVGILAFGGLLSSGERNSRSCISKPVLMELHKYAGTYIHILVSVTIMLGIQEKEGFVGCGYKVESADLMPFLNYGLIPYACKISHDLGLVILAMGLFTSFGLARFPVL
mmetsp:Transcript_32290/g.69701  ORF Transcript_32290/g.69701 Transcript_32290/m.69701 type:complete len:306 (+) Transcript_32290:210-1127(+)